VTWDVAVAGTFHHDDLTTPAGRRDVLGGSAVYFALAASRYAPVRLNGIVGTDTVAGYRAILDLPGVNLDGVVVSESPTFRWHAVHDFQTWATAREASEPGCDPEWAPQLPDASAQADVLFVASMDPGLQRDVLDQSHARLIGIDSMTEFVQSRRDEVFALVARADVLFLTGDELSVLTGTDDWRSSAVGLCGNGRLRAVVVKRGPLGAACVTARGVTEMEAVPIDAVVDPTGAGDALAGGFLGHAALTEQADERAFDAALAQGLLCAADAIGEFGTAGLRGRTRTV
jgi:sugar/nucleoside kinase (ribokinase family)